MSGYLNVYDLIEGFSGKNQKIISFYDDYNLVCQKSFAEIHQDVIAVSKKLITQLEKNEIFFVSFPNTYEFLILFLGSLKAGVIPAPIASPDSMSKSEYHDYLAGMKSQTQIQKILAPEIHRSELVKNGFEVVSIDKTSNASQAQQFLNNPQKPKLLPDLLRNQIAFIQFSSGSTSEPKGVLISHTALIESISINKRALELSDRSVVVSWIPLFHDMGLVGGLLTPLFTPFESHILKPGDFARSPDRFLELTTRIKATVWIGPDSMYRKLSKILNESKFSIPIDLSSLEICICGSEPILFETYNQFSQSAIPYGWKPQTFVPSYGLSENVLSISFSQLRTHLKTHEKNKRMIVSCGKPAGEIKVQILDENQKLVKDGIEGLIWVQSPSLCSGFLDNEDFFKENRLGSWFFTGDIGFVRDGEIYISGRFKEMIIVDSKKYFFVDLEQRIWNLIGHGNQVKKVVVVGKGSIGGDESISICIEWLDFLPPLSFRRRQDIRSKIIHNLKNQMKINKTDIHYVGVRSLPRTTSGKLKRYLIKNRINKGQLKNNLWSVFWRSWIFGLFSKSIAR